MDIAAFAFALLIGIAAITFANSFKEESDVQTCLNKQNSPEECKVFIIKDK